MKMKGVMENVEDIKELENLEQDENGVYKDTQLEKAKELLSQ